MASGGHAHRRPSCHDCTAHITSFIHCYRKLVARTFSCTRMPCCKTYFKRQTPVSSLCRSTEPSVIKNNRKPRETNVKSRNEERNNITRKLDIFCYTIICCPAWRCVGKQNATAYAAKDVQGGMAVTRPPWMDDFCTIATMQRHIPANARASRIYLKDSQLRVSATPWVSILQFTQHNPTGLI